jgi:hypothetical protein
VVLQDVADRARGVVVAAAAGFHADRLGDGDLHQLDVFLVPQRLEEGVAEAEHQQVLHRLLAEVVVDAVELVLAQQAEQRIIEGTRARQIGAEGLLHHHPARQMVMLIEQADRLEVLHRRQAEIGLHRQVEDAMAGATGDRGQACTQIRIVGTRLEMGLHIAGQLEEGLPAVVAAALHLWCVLGQDVAEGGIVPRAAGDADQLQAAGEQTLAIGSVQRRYQFACCQVTGCAEDDDLGEIGSHDREDACRAALEKMQVLPMGGSPAILVE